MAAVFVIAGSPKRRAVDVSETTSTASPTDAPPPGAIEFRPSAAPLPPSAGSHRVLPLMFAWRRPAGTMAASSGGRPESAAELASSASPAAKPPGAMARPPVASPPLDD